MCLFLTNTSYVIFLQEFAANGNKYTYKYYSCFLITYRAFSV